ncbi:FHA domain-containing protein [bacterium]|nr:FHA domain-containing protein [bacterium]
MTWKLVVVAGKGRGTEFGLGGKPVFDVGSAPTADARLEDADVAPVHVKINDAAGELSAFDVSGRGFLHNGKRTLKSVLRDGDLLRLGQHELRFVALAAPGAAPAEDTAPPVASEIRCGLRALKGNDAGKSFDLGSKDMFILGRGVATDITVWDIRASRVHCRIDHDATGHTITDLNASNGTYVNGEKVEHVRLKPGDEIKIGSTVLQYFSE